MIFFPQAGRFLDHFYFEYAKCIPETFIPHSPGGQTLLPCSERLFGEKRGYGRNRERKAVGGPRAHLEAEERDGNLPQKIFLQSEPKRKKLDYDSSQLSPFRALLIRVSKAISCWYSPLST